MNDWVTMCDEFEEGGYKQSGRGRLRLRSMISSSTGTSCFNQVSSRQESPRSERTLAERVSARGWAFLRPCGQSLPAVIQLDYLIR